MRILLIHQFFLEDHEGGGSRWNELSRIWTQLGHEVTVLAGTAHYMHTKSAAANGKFFNAKTNCDGVKVIRCYVANERGPGFLGRLWAQCSFMSTAIWGGVFNAKGKYDIIICTSPPLFVGVAGLFISRVKGIRFILEIRDLWPESAIETGVLKNKYLINAAFWLENQLYNRAIAINALTPAFRTILISQKKVEESKVWLIPNAADFGISAHVSRNFDRTAFRKELGVDDKFVIIYVGAHGIANHLIQLIETAEILQDSAVHFLLIGDGLEKEYLQKEAKWRQLSNVTFVDTVSKTEVFQFILAADAGTSVLKKAEVFKTVYSNKTFDYFTCRKPVLMAIDGVSRQLITDAGAGLYVEPENPADFAAKILFYMSNPTIARQHGDQGHDYARKHFDRVLLAEKYLKHIQDLTEK